MEREQDRRTNTGHRDCCGKDINGFDIVVTKDGEGHVIWGRGKWWILFRGGPMKALNSYPAEALRKVENDGTMTGQRSMSHQAIVPGQ